MNPYLAEFIGTAILILLGNGAVANVVLNKSKGNGGGWIVITTGWALAVAMGVYAVGRVSGAHLNPAVSIALASLGSFPWADVPGYIAAQIAGAFTGATLVWLAYLAHWGETSDQGTKLACFSTSSAVPKVGPAIITEIIGSAMLVFGVLAIGKAGTGATGVISPDVSPALAGVIAAWWGPLLVGLLVFAIGISLGGPTGYAINPARDFGPRLAHQFLPIAGKGGSNWKYAWIPIVAPIIGGLVGAFLFKATFGI